jgi:hypothetical protein
VPIDGFLCGGQPIRGTIGKAARKRAKRGAVLMYQRLVSRCAVLAGLFLGPTFGIDALALDGVVPEEVLQRGLKHLRAENFREAEQVLLNVSTGETVGIEATIGRASHKRRWPAIRQLKQS